MVRRTNNPKKKCGYKRCKWPRLKYKKYCEQHEDKFLEGTPIMRTFSQILAENKGKPVIQETPTPEAQQAMDTFINKPTFKQRVKRFIFK